jgi:hypothetical protein
MFVVVDGNHLVFWDPTITAISSSLQELILSSLNVALVDWESLDRQLTSALAKLQLLESFGSEAVRHASEQHPRLLAHASGLKPICPAPYMSIA